MCLVAFGKEKKKVIAKKKNYIKKKNQGNTIQSLYKTLGVPIRLLYQV